MQDMLKGFNMGGMGGAGGVQMFNGVGRGERDRGSDFRGPRLNPLGLFLRTILHTVYMSYSECLPTLLNPLAERTCCSQGWAAAVAWAGLAACSAPAAPWAAWAAWVALEVKAILTPPCIIISLVILCTKYTGWRENDFNVHA